jgi:CAAX prenyl protease-like protein
LAHPLRRRIARAWSAPVYVVLLGVGIGATGLAPIAGAMIGAALAAWAWACRAPAGATGLAVAPLGLAAGIPWPIPALVAAGLAQILERALDPAVARIAVTRSCQARPRMGLEVVGAAVLCAPVGAALAALYLNGERIALELEPPAMVVVAVVVVLLALVNATSEEVLWRDRSIRILVHGGRSIRAVVAVQAMSFSLAHAYGLPGGALGSVGALVLGTTLGVLRFRRAGLLGCIVVHAFVDVAIFSVVGAQVVWIGHADQP